MGNGKNYAATAGGDKNTCLGRTQLVLRFMADDGPSEGCPHRAVKLDIRSLPFSESCAGRKRFQLLTKTGTLSRKSRELESVRRCLLNGEKIHPKHWY
jgi:hypothetical protein